MSVFVTGDLHGRYDFWKLDEFDDEGLTKDDYLIICGDFGLVWDYQGENDKEREYLEILENKPYTTLFVDGNHENADRLSNDYKVEKWHGGKAHKIRDSIIHLMRGQVFDIEGRKFFTMGGAPSHDIQYRTEGKTWWREEVPSEEERSAAIEKLEEYNWKVDYVITHDAPADIAERAIWIAHDFSREITEYNEWLQEIADKLEFKKWFFGHYHMDRWFDDEKYYCKYYSFTYLL